jgi:hypothetical protein
MQAAQHIQAGASRLPVAACQASMRVEALAAGSCHPCPRTPLLARRLPASRMCRARARNNRQQHAEECISAPMKVGTLAGQRPGACAAIGWQQPARLPGQVQVLEQLGGSDQATSAPIWASFCGVSNGAWQGTQTAFAPGTGRPRPPLPAARDVCQPACALPARTCCPQPGRRAERRLGPVCSFTACRQGLRSCSARQRARTPPPRAPHVRLPCPHIRTRPGAAGSLGRGLQASRRRSGRTPSGAR